MNGMQPEDVKKLASVKLYVDLTEQEETKAQELKEDC